jgi:hypothetical protein
VNNHIAANGGFKIWHDLCVAGFGRIVVYFGIVYVGYVNN